MIRLRTESLRWCVAGFCVLIGALLLVTPHQFDALISSALGPNLSWWGGALLLSGCVLIASAVRAPRDRFAIGAHLLAASVLLLFAGGLAMVGLVTRAL